MNTYSEVKAKTQALHEALERLYAARDTGAIVLSRGDVDRLSTPIEECASHPALAAPGSFD